jgi:hypothetical protein
MEDINKKLQKYLGDILGCGIDLVGIPKNELGKLPMFFTVIYNFYQASLFNIDFIIIERKVANGFSIYQLGKHIELLKNYLNKRIVLLEEVLSSLNRKRLIEKGINFIVSGKQLFLPDFLVDLREGNQNRGKKKTGKLLPSSQLILFYHILRNKDKGNLEKESFKQLASKFGYTAMAITKSVDNLLINELCTVEGTKEKSISFVGSGVDLWQLALPFLVNPVFKKIYVDERPQGILLFRSNESALPEYSAMNPSQQTYYAIERTKFYDLQNKGQLINPNDYEGKYCLELWKYNPAILAEGKTGDEFVDPLSLYLSLQNVRDERVDMALETILKKYLW